MKFKVGDKVKAKDVYKGYFVHHDTCSVPCLGTKGPGDTTLSANIVFGIENKPILIANEDDGTYLVGSFWVSEEALELVNS